MAFSARQPLVPHLIGPAHPYNEVRHTRAHRLTAFILFAALLLLLFYFSSTSIVLADSLTAWLNDQTPQGIIGPTSRVQCDQLRKQWASLRGSVSKKHDRCIASEECKRTLGSGERCQCASCEEVHNILHENPTFWNQGNSDFAACLISVKQYEDRQRRESDEKRNAAFEEFQQQKMASREERRRLAEQAHEQDRQERQKAERDLAFDNYERRLRGLPERERKKTTTEEVYLRGKEGKELKDAVDEAYEAFTNTATMTLKSTGKAVGSGVLQGVSPGLPPYPEAGPAYVDEDPGRAKAIDDKVRQEKRDFDRWYNEAERKAKEQDPYWRLVPPPRGQGPAINAAP